MSTPLSRAIGAPSLLGFIVSERVRRRPYALFRALQLLDPVHHSAFGIWLLSAHGDVAAALPDQTLSSDERKADMSRLRLGGIERLLVRGNRDIKARKADKPMHKLMLFRDPPDHTRLRGLVSKAFTPRRVEAMEPRISEIVAEHVERMRGRDRIDIMSDFAYPIPARVICELVGVPAEDRDLIVRHAPALATSLDPSPMRSQSTQRAGEAATDALVEYMTGLIEQRRREPGEDMLSALIAAERDGDRLSHEDLVATVLLLLIAGHETTANLVGNGLLAMLRDRVSFERFRDDVSIDRTAVEELLRFDSPVQMVLRVTTSDFAVGKQTIPTGSIVIPLIASANRDPSVFADPARLDLGRKQNPHLAFGGGAHFCIGAPLARLEGRIMLRQLIRAFPGMKLVATARRPSFVIRGVSRLEISVHR